MPFTLAGKMIGLPPDHQPKLALSHEVQFESAVAGVFLERVLAQGLAELRTDSWPTAASSFAALGKTELRYEAERQETALYDWDGTLVVAGRHGNHIYAIAAARDAAGVEAAMTKLHEHLPPPDPSSKHEVTVTFWTYGRHGPQQSWRTISVPEWDEISANYAEETRKGLESIMRGFRPAHGGQLILWRGEAGTGKTFALRALAWEWRDWCEFNYIVDPDSFFGEHADYLMSVLLEEGSPMAQMQRMMHSASAGFGTGGFAVFADGDDGDGDEAAGRAWRVLVLEDTGELLSGEARAAVGQGLSRFLNVVDGLIGQGLRVLVLVTTNEELRSLHPAVARPGRAAANLEFTALSPDEASTWLKTRAVDKAAATPLTLASLYALAEGREPAAVELASFAGDEEAAPD